MKKQFLFIAVATSVFMCSCSKDQITEQTISSSSQQQASKSSVFNRFLVVNPLLVNLEGWFPFDGNLKDSTGKLSTVVLNGRGPGYTSDRKYNLKSALYVDGKYFVKIKAVPQQTHTSLSVWFKSYNYNDTTAGGIVFNDARGPFLYQSGKKVGAAVATDVSKPGGYFDIFNSNWHHAVITFDGADVQVYIDNTLRATVPHQGSIAPTLVDYFIGWSKIYPNWKGYVDDLRFYSRTLTASDVNALYNF